MPSLVGSEMCIRDRACAHAGIAKDTYYRWIREKEGFSDEIEAAKSFIFIAAKKTIQQAVVKGDLKAAQWLLERRQKRLYSRDREAYYHQIPEGLTDTEQSLLDEVIEQNL